MILKLHLSQALAKLQCYITITADNIKIRFAPEFYIANNKTGIVNYEQRKNSKLVFTSNLAESTVNTLINERQKGRQEMLWSREGFHNVLQIRAAQRSESWGTDWKSVENKIYKLAA